MSKNRKKMLATLIVFSFVFSMISALSVSLQPQFAAQALVKIDSDLLEQMEEENGLHKALVKVAWNPDLESIKFNHDAVIAELKAEAAETQEPVLTYLGQKRDAEILNTFWLDNLILIKADEYTIRELATFTTVEKVSSVFNVTIPSGEMESADGSTTWNIEKVRAPEVWEELGITGEGVRFATTDSGIHLDHPDLAGTLYSDNYADPTYPGGWIELDASGNIVVGSVPHDTDGHGTATYGLVVGDANGPYGAVGMAPGAAGQGMHALTLPGGGGDWPQVLGGLQWVIDPYDQYGNPAGEWARVSSHSWGTQGHYHLSETINATRNMWYAGHLPIFSAGNGYEGHSGAPGNNYEAFSVGATDINDYVASFSSGEWVYKTDYVNPPTDWPDKWIHPEVSAPGDDVIVPYPPDTYISWEGTSFSSPLVCGAAVLMLSYNPSLTPAELQETLQETAVWYNYYYPSRPDTRYGWGRIDAYEAVRAVAPQGVEGYVTDAATGAPIEKAMVTAAGNSEETNAKGYYKLCLPLPGTYTLTFSRFCYESTTIPNVLVEKDKFTTLNVALTPGPRGYIAGHVRFGPTQIGIPGALVKVLDLPVPFEAITDVVPTEGYYSMAICPGTYNLEASAYGFKSHRRDGIVVEEGLTTVVDFDLTQPPVVAVIGDYPSTPGKITAFLQGKGYTVDAYLTLAAVTPKVATYSTIVVNRPTGSSTGAEVRNFIAATDANGVGVLWLDSWASYTGGYLLYYSTSPRWPPYRYTHYSSSIEYTYYKIVYATDPDLFPPEWGMNYIIKHDMGVGTDHDHAYYTGVVDGYFTNIGTVKRLTNVGDKYPTYFSDHANSQGIIKVTRDVGNKWVLLSMHANTPWTMIDYWHDDTKTVFLNSINWVSKTLAGGPLFVKWGLKAEPSVTMWKYPVTVSVGIKNVGWATGTHTVNMKVDGILEGTATVTLAPGTYAYPSWTVSRFEVGTYTVTVQHLTTTFRVRPPIIEVKATEFCTDQPLAGADVYGCYRKYTGPGWYEQWSKAYGGNGHSQFAQPIGDLDGDKVNEVVVGGYETAGMCRILSYDKTKGTYVEEYSWTHGGGSYNSPSGATMLDLDGDGKLELVVSWGYSGANDGVWAYKWDGTKLTPLDHWLGGFVFDVYTCDYDDDGVKEVLVANAPAGPDAKTPNHVLALGWQSGHFVIEATWTLSGYTSYECMMLWSGDTDNDTKTEVIASISSGSSSTQGTWALNWASGTWTAVPVYTGGFPGPGGTHYGVVAGDVDGDGIPEIGIGNNVAGYVGAAAVLIEWDTVTSTYKKVWEGSWSSENCIIEGVYIGDADNDGKNEFVAGGGYIHIIGWTGTEYAEEWTITKTAGMLSGCVIGDCDTDGKNEVKACDIVGLGPGKEWIFKYSPVPTPLPTWEFKKFGTTDANGKLVFDSPASVVDIYLFVYKGEKSEKGYQYLLEKDMTINNDIAVTYEPHAETEAIIISRLDSYVVNQLPHMGITWLHKKNICCDILWPFVSYFTDPTNIVVSCATYNIYHELNIEDQWGLWTYYFMNPNREVTLCGGQTYKYTFAGPIKGYIKFTQTGDQITIKWDATDNYGHQITGIHLDEVGWLTSSSSETSITIKPGLLDDIQTQVAASSDYYPLIALYAGPDFKNVIVSGYVQWNEKTVTITVTKNVAHAHLKFVAGPYGNPNDRMYVVVIADTK